MRQVLIFVTKKRLKLLNQKKQVFFGTPTLIMIGGIT